MIIEQTDSFPGGQTMMTVQTDRGDEYVINADAAVDALAQFLSDYDNNQRFGWTLTAAWFEDKVAKLRAAALSSKEQ